MIDLFNYAYWSRVEISWLDLFIFIAAVTLFILMWKRKSS